MGTATMNRLTLAEAQEELSGITAALGDLDAARARSAAALLPPEEEHMLRRAEELIWLIGD